MPQRIITVREHGSDSTAWFSLDAWSWLLRETQGKRDDTKEGEDGESATVMAVREAYRFFTFYFPADATKLQYADELVRTEFFQLVAVAVDNIREAFAWWEEKARALYEESTEEGEDVALRLKAVLLVYPQVCADFQEFRESLSALSDVEYDEMMDEVASRI